MFAINIWPDQDSMVVPFLTSSGYTFTAVKDSDEAIQKAYNVIGAPTNLLIDAEGRVVARPLLSSVDEEASLGAWIELLLGARPATPVPGTSASPTL